MEKPACPGKTALLCQFFLRLLTLQDLSSPEPRSSPECGNTDAQYVVKMPHDAMRILRLIYRLRLVLHWLESNIG
jgi:hypothetical protein